MLNNRVAEKLNKKIGHMYVITHEPSCVVRSPPHPTPLLPHRPPALTGVRGEVCRPPSRPRVAVYVWFLAIEGPFKHDKCAISTLHAPRVAIHGVYCTTLTNGRRRARYL